MITFSSSFLIRSSPVSNNTLFSYSTRFSTPPFRIINSKESDPRVCERFEIYIEGVELANCFNELCDLETQKKRSEKDLKLKEELYHYSLPAPHTLFRSLEKGLPPSARIALGVERLFSIITKEKKILF